jgi:hypothetical protein
LSRRRNLPNPFSNNEPKALYARDAVGLISQNFSTESTFALLSHDGGFEQHEYIVKVRISRRAEASDDRRTSERLPIERDVCYKVLNGKRRLINVGSGRTLNMSGGGVLFTTESALRVGELVELSVSWPARLNNLVPLKLVVVGRLVRVEETQAAIAIQRYEFKTSGSKDR